VAIWDDVADWVDENIVEPIVEDVIEPIIENVVEPVIDPVVEEVIDPAVEYVGKEIWDDIWDDVLGGVGLGHNKSDSVDLGEDRELHEGNGGASLGGQRHGLTIESNTAEGLRDSIWMEPSDIMPTSSAADYFTGDFIDLGGAQAVPTQDWSQEISSDSLWVNQSMSAKVSALAEYVDPDPIVDLDYGFVSPSPEPYYPPLH
jgi:hypothetical protein